MKTSAGLTESVHNELRDVFTTIGCFKETFILQVRERTMPNQSPQGCMTHALQKPFKDELD